MVLKSMDINTFVILGCLCLGLYASSEQPLPPPYRLILAGAVLTLGWQGLTLGRERAAALRNWRPIQRLLRRVAGW